MIMIIIALFVILVTFGFFIFSSTVLSKFLSRKFKLETLQKAKNFFNRLIVICLLILGITFLVILSMPKNSLTLNIGIIWVISLFVLTTLSMNLPYALQKAITLKKIDYLISYLADLDGKNESLPVFPIKTESQSMLSYDLMNNFTWELKLIDPKKKWVELRGKDCLGEIVHHGFFLDLDSFEELENSFDLNI